MDTSHCQLAVGGVDTSNCHDVDECSGCDPALSTGPVGVIRSRLLARKLVLPSLSCRTVEPPDIRFVQEQPPSVICISVPQEGPASSCNGTYLLSLDTATGLPETANGLPCWMLQDGSHWLFSSLQGRWLVGGVDLRFDEFWRNTGYVASCERHYGRMPQRMDATSWRMWTGMESVDDARISVTELEQAVATGRDGPRKKAAEPGAGARELLDEATDDLPLSTSTAIPGLEKVPSSVSSSMDSVLEELRTPEQTSCRLPLLCVETCNWQRSCNGTYVPVPGTMANGMPVWQHEQGGRWIFCGTDGRWYVGGKLANANKFSVCSGYICHEAHNRGRLPHEIRGPWLWGDTRAWHQDPSIRVFATASV